MHPEYYPKETNTCSNDPINVEKRFEHPQLRINLPQLERHMKVTINK